MENLKSMSADEWVEYLQRPGSTEELELTRSSLVAKEKIRAIQKNRVGYHEVNQKIAHIEKQIYHKMLTENEADYLSLFINEKATDQECRKIHRALMAEASYFNAALAWDGLSARMLMYARNDALWTESGQPVQ